MATVYELNFSGEQIQISKDLIFGWCIRTVEPGMVFQPVSDLNEEQLEFLKSFPFPAYIPQEFREALNELTASRLSKPEAVVAVTPPAKPAQSAGVTDQRPDPVLMSRLKISQAICERLHLVEKDRYIADLEYCTVERRMDVWIVTGVSASRTVEEFPSAQAAVEYIARRWW